MPRFLTAHLEGPIFFKKNHSWKFQHQKYDPVSLLFGCRINETQNKHNPNRRTCHCGGTCGGDRDDNGSSRINEKKIKNKEIHWALPKLLINLTSKNIFNFRAKHSKLLFWMTGWGKKTKIQEQRLKNSRNEQRGRKVTHEIQGSCLLTCVGERATGRRWASPEYGGRSSPNPGHFFGLSLVGWIPFSMVTKKIRIVAPPTEQKLPLIFNQVSE